MLRRISVLLVLSIFTVPVSLAGEVLSLEELKEIQEKLKSGDHMAVSFVQEKYTNLRKKIQTSRGWAKFSKPELFRWVIEEPVAEQWIFDGKQLLNYLPATERAARFATDGDKARQLRDIVDLVMNFDTLLSRYNLIKAEMSGEKVLVELKPRRAGEVEQVDLHLEVKTNFVSYLRLHFNNKNHTTLKFEKPSYDALPKSTFQLKDSVKISDTL